MNRSILLSILSIFAVVALVGGLTLAYFSDVGISSNNVFATGTLDLKLSDSTPETDQDNVSVSFGGTLAPGNCTGDQILTLKNTGTIAGDHAEVHLANAISDANANAEPDIDTFLRLNLLNYDSVSKLSQITETNGNGFADLEDWAAPANAGVLDNLALTDLNGGHNLVMDVCLDSSAGDTLQGDSVTSTFTVDLNQNASQ